MAGDFRFALADTEFLNHPTNSARETLPPIITASVLRDRAARFDETDNQITNLFAARTGHPVDWFRDDANDLGANSSVTITPPTVGVVGVIGG